MANIKIPQLGSAQSISDNNYLVVDDGLSTLKATAKQLKEYATNDVKAEIAPDWAENISYSAGDFVNWNGYIKKCLLAHLSSESLTPANGTYWESTSVGEELYLQNLNYANMDQLKFDNIPYNSFSWNNNNGCFTSNNDYIAPTGWTVIGFLATGLNGNFILAGRYASASNKVNVIGWNPTGDANIQSNIIFSCYAILKKV